MAEKGFFGKITDQLGDWVGKAKQLEGIQEPPVTDVNSLKAAALARAQRAKLSQGIPSELTTRASDADALLQLLTDPQTAPYVRQEDLRAAGFGFLLETNQPEATTQYELPTAPEVPSGAEEPRLFARFRRPRGEQQYVPPVDDTEQARKEELADRYAMFRNESGVDHNVISLGREMALRPGTVSEIAPRAFPDSSSLDAAGQKAFKARTPLQETLPHWGMKVKTEPGVGKSGARYGIDIIDDWRQREAALQSPIELFKSGSLSKDDLLAQISDADLLQAYDSGELSPIEAGDLHKELFAKEYPEVNINRNNRYRLADGSIFRGSMAEAAAANKAIHESRTQK